jgi:hypothetical protein
MPDLARLAGPDLDYLAVPDLLELAAPDSGLPADQDSEGLAEPDSAEPADQDLEQLAARSELSARTLTIRRRSRLILPHQSHTAMPSEIS